MTRQAGAHPQGVPERRRKILSEDTKKMEKKRVGSARQPLILLHNAAAPRV